MSALEVLYGRPESTSQVRPLNVRLERSLGVISGRPQDVRLGSPQDGQIGSLGDVLRTTWGPIFAGSKLTKVNNFYNEIMCKSNSSFGSYYQSLSYRILFYPSESIKKCCPVEYKQLSRGVLGKKCSENKQQIYKETLILKCDFNKLAKQLY